MNSIRIFSLCAAALMYGAAFSQTIDGQKDGSYTSVGVQNTETGFGDNSIGDIARANGSELDNIQFVRTATDLYIFIGGNLENGAGIFQKVAIFFDSVAGGYNRLPAGLPDIDFNRFIRFGDDGSGNGLTFDTGFDADHFIGFVNGGDPVGVFVNYSQVETIANGGVAYYMGTTTPGSNGVLTGGNNPNGVEGTINNLNTAGVPGGIGIDPGNGAGVNTGIELKIPLAQIGNPTGPIKICAFVFNDGFDFLSNQVLNGIGGGDNLADPRLVNLSTIAGDQFVTIPGGSAPEVVTPQDANDFNIVRGQAAGGSITDVQSDNNVAFGIRKFFNVNPTEAIHWVEWRATTTILNPSMVEFRVKSRMVTGGQFRYEMEQFNWNTSGWENLVSANPFNLTYATRVSTASPATNKVSGTGRVQGRTRVFRTGITANPLPVSEYDLVNWTVTP